MTDKEMRIRIGKRLKRARQVKKLTQKDLAALVEISDKHVSAIERGENASFVLLLRLAEALDIDMNYLMMDTNLVKPKTYIDNEISKRLDACNPATLRSVCSIIDVLLIQQNEEAEARKKEME